MPMYISLYLSFSLSLSIYTYIRIYIYIYIYIYNMVLLFPGGFVPARQRASDKSARRSKEDEEIIITIGNTNMKQ